MINGLDGMWHSVGMAHVRIAQARFNETHGTTQDTRGLDRT